MEYYARRLNFRPIRPNPNIPIARKTMVDPESGTPDTRLRFTLSRMSPMLSPPSLWKLRLIVVGARTVNDIVSIVSGVSELRE